MLVEFTKLQHIVAVARTASFSRAAEECFITQPALSRSIAGFEARHDVRLFERRRGGIVPTPAGRMVVERARAILAAARELEDSLGSHAAGDSGEVALGLGPLVASLVLPPLSRRLLDSRPGLALRTTIKTHTALLADLRDDKLDLLLANPVQPEVLVDCEVRMIVKLPLVVIVRSDHPLAGKRGLTSRDLAAWPAAVQTLSTAATGMQAGMFACENHHVLRDVVLFSDTYSCTARAFVSDELADGRLVALDIADYPFREIDLAIMCRRHRKLSAAALGVEEEAAYTLARLAGDQAS